MYPFGSMSGSTCREKEDDLGPLDYMVFFMFFLQWHFFFELDLFFCFTISDIFILQMYSDEHLFHYGSRNLDFLSVTSKVMIIFLSCVLSLFWSIFSIIFSIYIYASYLFIYYTCVRMSSRMIFHFLFPFFVQYIWRYDIFYMGYHTIFYVCIFFFYRIFIFYLYLSIYLSIYIWYILWKYNYVLQNYFLFLDFFFHSMDVDIWSFLC